MAEVSISGNVLERSAATILTRVVNPNTRQYITQASLSSITYEVFDRNDSTRILSGGTLVIADTVFDTLQTDDAWEDIDDIGYNFAPSFAGTSEFPTNHNYALTIKFTPVTGNAFYLPGLLFAERNYFGDTA